MNVCAKCGTAMAGGVMSCPACGGLPVRRAAGATAWQQVATGAVGFGLLGTAWALALGFVHVDAEDNLVAVSLIAVGAPFALAIFVPFATLRRRLVAVGTGTLWAIGAAVAGASILDPGSEYENLVTVPTLISIGGLAGFCLGAYVGYRLAR